MLFFDIDNTLIDHQKAQENAITKLSRSLNIVDVSIESLVRFWNEFSCKYYQKYLAGSLTFSEQRLMRIKYFFQKFKPQELNKTPEQLFSQYLHFYESSWILFNDAKRLINKIYNKTPIGIITNGETEQQKKKLTSVGIKKYFDLLITSHDIGVGKPNKKIFLLAANKANIPIEQCYYVGDDFENDALAASKTGMNAFWINRNQYLNKDIPDNIKTICDLSEILNYLGKTT